MKYFKYLSYFFWIIVLFLFFFFFKEYLSEHEYYIKFLLDHNNIKILFWAILWALCPLVYTFSEWKKSWLKIVLFIFIWFAIFGLGISLIKWAFSLLWYLIFILNFLILFLFFSVFVIWCLALWEIFLSKFNFNESIYNFSIKTWVGIALFSIIIFYLTSLWFLNIIVSYLLFIGLLIIIYFNWRKLKLIFDWLLESFNNFSVQLNKIHPALKFVFGLIFVIIFLYIFFWFVYSFIPYPSAWDANHAYMFIPKIFSQYWWYPWAIDYRPKMWIWSTLLSWVYNIGFFSRFSQDTWMITFNFLSWIFSLFFGFMLVNTIVKLISPKKNFKHYILIILWYILLLTWLTSWMGAFLVFVDNKTDLAVFMFTILALFLAIYAIFKQEEIFIQDSKILSEETLNYIELNEKEKLNDKNIKKEKKSIYYYFWISWFFFGIANLIKPTATFDFFETFLVFSVLNVWVFLLIWWVLFVLWFLYQLKFRGFDKIISQIVWVYDNFFWTASMWSWFILSILSIFKSFKKKSFKIIWLIIFCLSFIWTLFFTKGFFWLVQIYKDKNVDLNPKKVAISLLTSNKFPTIKKETMTWDLYEWLSEPIWSSYKEDNWRYVWYWNRNFIDPWWAFLVPKQFKQYYNLYFNEKLNDKTNKKNFVYFLNAPNDIKNKILNDYANQIFQNKNYNYYKKTILSNIEEIWIKELADKIGIKYNESTSDWKLKKNVFDQYEKNTRKNLKNTIINDYLLNGIFDINEYPKILNTEKNKKLLNNIKNKNKKISLVSIPYNYLVPFNVVFNWSLQNRSSYYTDIWIVWIFLFLIAIFAFIHSLFTRDKLMWAFAFATLIWWAIWYWVASWIVWYNIWWIIWLILVSILYVHRLKDKLFLWYILIFISFISIILNFSRIASQWWGKMQFFYKTSIWKDIIDYEMKDWWIQVKREDDIWFNFEDYFDLQFKMYNKPIKYFNNRSKWEVWLIAGTYMRYFIKNQDNIINDQFLKYLWKLFSDENIDKIYKRLKDQKIWWIVIDPNIASVVLWEWNKSLWYRYYWKTNSNWNVVKKWVIPILVDLYNAGKLEYWYSNNIWFKYAITVSDEVLSKVSWIKDKEKLLELRYHLTSIKFVNNLVDQKLASKAFNVVLNLMDYRRKNEMFKFAKDIADIKWLHIENIDELLKNIQNFNNDWSIDKKELYLNLLNFINSNDTWKLLNNLVSNSIGWGAQLFFVKIK